MTQLQNRAAGAASNTTNKPSPRRSPAPRWTILPTLVLAGGTVCLASAGGCSDDSPPAASVTSGPGATSSTGQGGDGASGGAGGTGQGGAANGGNGGAGGELGDENCFNGLDDNDDDRVDCVDNDPACAAVCTDACAEPMALSDPATVTGDTTEHGVLTGSSCTAGPGAGPTHVYSITATQTGVLEAYLATADENDNFSISVRTDCATAGSELGCEENVFAHEPPAQEFISVPATMGETYYVVVQGFSFLDYGDYSLTVGTRVPSCPDGFLDPTEECDDGDMIDDNGCSNGCVFQPTETETNDAPGEADVFVAPWYAQIDPVGDSDMIEINVPEDNYGVLVSVFDLGNGACAMAKLDSYLQLFDSGLTERAFDDNGGDGLCSRMTGRGLSTGTHYLRVRAAPMGLPDHTFQYQVAVEGDRCGNNNVAGPEECDDGNLDNGDGCSQFCNIE